MAIASLGKVLRQQVGKQGGRRLDHAWARRIFRRISITKHAEIPSLCPDCLALAHAIADQDARPIIARWCEERKTLAVARKRGGPVIVSWELHLAPTIEDAKLLRPLLHDIFSTGMVARPPKGCTARLRAGGTMSYVPVRWNACAPARLFRHLSPMCVMRSTENRSSDFVGVARP